MGRDITIHNHYPKKSENYCYDCESLCHSIVRTEDMCCHYIEIGETIGDLKNFIKDTVQNIENIECTWDCVKYWTRILAKAQTMGCSNRDAIDIY